jgi:hypothetical protein
VTTGPDPRVPCRFECGRYFYTVRGEVTHVTWRHGRDQDANPRPAPAPPEPAPAPAPVRGAYAVLVAQPVGQALTSGDYVETHLVLAYTHEGALQEVRAKLTRFIEPQRIFVLETTRIADAPDPEHEE